MMAKNQRCKATKADGTACRASSLPGSKYCFFHDPDREEERQAGRRAGGQTGRAAALPSDTEFVDLKTPADIVGLLGDTINRVRVGAVDPRVGNCIGYLAGVAMKAMEQGDIEARLAALEAAVAAAPKEASLFDLGLDELEYASGRSAQ